MTKQYFYDKKFFPVLVGFFIALFLITSSVKMTLNFRPLYYYDIEYLEIEDLSGVDKQEIIENYDALINYLKTTYKGELEFPTFSMSIPAKIHFEEVKNIFVMLDYLMLLSLILGGLGVLKLIQLKNYQFIKWSAILLIAIPVTLVLPLAVDFNSSFIIFHKIFFRNDYWIFDPWTDPIITVLPQEYFMHCAFMIIAIILIESLILFILNKKIN
ncbi:MAG: integral rane protein [Haloplasmataceae bacterium]|jgi:integral membrane protein (TIGR01906 family)|nr:integral rane protein [Haloplasmataceae bacterium]